MKYLPIAKTEFREIIEGNFHYVDKTRYIKEIVEDRHTYYFLSRPRRFGKSLFLDTMQEAFEGNKKLFKGLYLENNWDWETKYPVIAISLGRFGIKSAIELQMVLVNMLNGLATDKSVELNGTLPQELFFDLIQKLHRKHNQPVVILIDEYDKPLLDNITKNNIEEIREELSSFYSVLKDASADIKLVFLTGVSRFSKTSIFSKLNNLTDLSMNEKYADICGITQTELEQEFASHLKDLDLGKVKQWYDGYNFRGSNLYNPYDLLMFLWERRYKPYWFETGTPTFLMELIKSKKFFLPSLDDMKIYESQLGEFDINYIKIETLLFQTGYLSIKAERQIGPKNQFLMTIPNMEVRMGLTDYLLRMFYASAISASEQANFSEQIYFAIAENRPQDLEQSFKSFFASVPYQWYVNNDIAHFEGFYSSLFYAFFAAQGFNIIPEDFTNKGRMDMSIKTDESIFIFEFKIYTEQSRNMENQTGSALQQIKDRKYFEKYLSENKAIYLIGIEFDEAERNISLFECEKLTV